MTVKVTPEGIALEGACTIEDAETLRQALITRPGAPVDWRSCDAAHTAVIQILLAAGPPLHGPPGGEFLREHVAPLLIRRSEE